MRSSGAFWLGAGMVVASQAAQLLFLLAAAQEQWDAAAVDAVGGILSVFTLLLPLGIAFVAFALVGRAVERMQLGGSGGELGGVGGSDGGGGDAGEESSWSGVFSPRAVFIAGIVLVALGLVLDRYLAGWQFAASAQRGLLRDAVFSLLPLVNAIAPQLGVLLIPASWLLGLLRTRVARAELRPTP